LRHASTLAFSPASKCSRPFARCWLIVRRRRLSSSRLICFVLFIKLIVIEICIYVNTSIGRYLSNGRQSGLAPILIEPVDD
jgi:hypothetical protein